MANHALSAQPSYSFDDDDAAWTDLRAVSRRQSEGFPVSRKGRAKEKWLYAHSDRKAVGRRPSVDAQLDSSSEDERSAATDPTSSISAVGVPDLIETPELDQHEVYFVSAQEWDGYVEAVNEDSFDGVVVPVGSEAEYAEDAVTIPFNLLADYIVRMIKPGVLFRMAAGHVRIKRQIIHGVRIYIRKDTSRPVTKWLQRDAFEAAFGE